MSTKKHEAANDLDALADNARALMTATSDVAGEKVAAARKSLNAALDSAKEIADNLREKAVAGAKATHEAVQENPYKTAGIALAVGMVFGFLISRRSSRRDD